MLAELKAADPDVDQRVVRVRAGGRPRRRPRRARRATGPRSRGSSGGGRNRGRVAKASSEGSDATAAPSRATVAMVGDVGRTEEVAASVPASVAVGVGRSERPGDAITAVEALGPAASERAATDCAGTDDCDAAGTTDDKHRDDRWHGGATRPGRHGGDTHGGIRWMSDHRRSRSRDSAPEPVVRSLGVPARRRGEPPGIARVEERVRTRPCRDR